MSPQPELATITVEALITYPMIIIGVVVLLGVVVIVYAHRIMRINKNEIAK